MSKSTYPEFKVPDGYITPEGVGEGETFEDIATFRVKANGMICLTKMGDTSLEEGSDKASSEEPEDYGTAEGLTSRLTQAYKGRS